MAADSVDNEHHTKRSRRRKRSQSRERHVEIMVAVDAELRRHHGADLDHYILTLMAIVASIYRDASVGNAINIVLMKVVVLETDQASKMISKNAADTLRSFCKWQHDINVEDDADPRHHDTAVLLTRRDICRSSQKCDTLGLAELGTMCDPHRSCSIIKDSGLSSAFTIAHELGHVFSMRHDDECNGNKSVNKSVESYHVMAPTLDYETKPWSWSECSRDKVTEFLDAGLGECLNDLPTENLAERFQYTDVPAIVDRRRSAPGRGTYQQLPGSAYTADQQCAQAFEHETQRCPYMPVCTRLWCTNPDNENAGCKTQHMPWADGTPCSNVGAKDSMWCYRGQCVPKRSLKPRDGEWGSWQPYQACSRSCGGGIKKSIRLCNNPQPENGGKFCIGRRVRYKSCNHQDCPATSMDFRELQCSKFNGKHFNINGLTDDVTWVSKYSGINTKDRCKLFCRVATSTAYYQLAERVIDGTKCGPETSDVCVMGQCRRAGCDNRLGSSTKYDKCGVCGGDNSQCKQVAETYSPTTKVVYGYNSVTRIPKGATNIDIRQYAPNDSKDDDMYLALVDVNGSYVLNGNFIVSAFHKELHVSGSILEYTGSGTAVERLNGTGMIYDDIIVHVLTVGDMRHTPVVQWQYTIRSNHGYAWSKMTKNWSNCSALCNGVQTRRVVCVSKDSGAIVSNDRCTSAALPRPEDSERSCHVGCRLSWRVHAVGECPARCRERGVAVRDVRCAKLSNDGKRGATYVSDEHCRHLELERPETTVECIGSCKATRWLYSAWSECSRSCDGGEQSRRAECIDIGGRRVADAECKHERKTVTQKCNVEQSCPHWFEGEWTACSVTCGRGWRFRAVQCKQGDNNVLKDRCSPNGEPNNRRECNAGPCPVWETSVWSQCSTTCGKGIQHRSVRCRLTSGSVVDDSACNAAQKPRHLASCRATSCSIVDVSTTASAAPTVPAPITESSAAILDESNSSHPSSDGFAWRTGGWTECSVTCGRGIRQRYVSCRDANDKEADSSFCRYADIPSSVEQCTARPCGHWRTGDWTPCSVTCGDGGLETRYVACLIQNIEDDSEQIVGESYCDVSTRPLAERECHLAVCSRYRRGKPDVMLDNVVNRDVSGSVSAADWRAGPWSPCSSTCDAGIQLRRIICEDSLVGTVDDSKCTPTTRPADQQSCNSGPCPQWNHGEWSPCDVTCGTGMQQRIVHCQLPSSEILPDANCLDFPPSRVQPCRMAACSRDSLTSTTTLQPPQWTNGPWSQCSVTCEKGIKVRKVTCTDGAGNVFSDRHCAGVKPRDSTTCRRGKCPRWSTTPWTQCSATCGPGVRTRIARCISGQSQPVDSSHCKKHLIQPATVEPCLLEPCEQYTWSSTDWSQCSHTCGFGVQHRRVICTEVTSNRAVEDKCRPLDRPQTQRECSLTPCPAMWITSDWTRCSVSCGVGIQKRAVSCRAVAREGWLLPGYAGPQACDETERPESERTCSYSDCQLPYRWETTAWSSCSKTCGFGRATRDVYCVGTAGQRLASNLCQSKQHPETQRQCYMGPCYSTSCKQLKLTSAAKADGEFNLLIQGKLVQIYCSEMAGPHPQEYLSLVASENDNYSEVHDKRLMKPTSCPSNDSIASGLCTNCFRGDVYQESGRTTFSKVRLNVTSLEVITNDFTFSRTHGFKQVPFASAGDCYSSSGRCPQGRFRVHLAGTDFRVADDVHWNAYGVKAVQRIQTSTDRQLVDGACGGYCGQCSPANNGFLRLQLIH